MPFCLIFNVAAIVSRAKFDFLKSDILYDNSFSDAVEESEVPFIIKKI